MSQICKYHLRGSCKYGHRCHFLHEDPYDHSYQQYGSSQQQHYYRNNSRNSYGQSYQNRDYSQDYDKGYSQNYDRGYSQQSHRGSQNYYATQSYSNDRYHVDHRQQQQQQSQSREPKSPGSISPIEFLEFVNFELMQHERGHAWPFTVIAPVKDFGNIPGFKDCSPEEVRYQYYEAVSNNTLFEFEKRIREAQNEIIQFRELFRSKSTEAVNILKTMMSQTTTSNTATAFSSPAASTFSFDLRKLHENQTTATSMESNSFNVVPTAGTAFGSPLANHNAGVQFSTNPQQPFFGQPTTANPANQSQSFNTMNRFDPGTRNIIQPVDDTLYSDAETLPSETLQTFQAKTFESGKIPIVPPPRQLCFS